MVLSEESKPLYVWRKERCPCGAHAAFSYAPYSDRSGLPLCPISACTRVDSPFHPHTHDLALSSSSHFKRSGIVSVPEPGLSPYALAGVRGPDGEGTFLSSIAAGSRPSSLKSFNNVFWFIFTDNDRKVS